MEAARLIFVDESGLWQGERLAYGYAPRGERCTDYAPYRVGRRTSLVGFVGLRGGAVARLSGTVTAQRFEAFVREALVPVLRSGDVVIWDGARIHSAAAVALVEQAGARVVVQPPYSPEFNAIEHLWSKIKHLVRRARADTAEALASALSAALKAITEQDVRGWIEHCGYRADPPT